MRIALLMCALIVLYSSMANGTESSLQPPAYLKDYEALYQHNPRQANLQWFEDAKYGLFIHWGLYSIEGIDPFEQKKNLIPVAEYEKKADQFRAENFDADFIADLTVKSKMKYITFVAKHCDGFCLWDTKYTEFNSMNSAAKRDFVKELYDACQKRGLGLFIFYEYGFEWHHPHAPQAPKWDSAIDYEKETGKRESSYAYDDEYDMSKYVEYGHAQMLELLEKYPEIAGIWVDGAGPLMKDVKGFRMQELYDKIHEKSPYAIVSCKWGITHTEDFYAPETGQYKVFTKQIPTIKLGSKPLELCDSLMPGWGYRSPEWRKKIGGKIQDSEWVKRRIKLVSYLHGNLLLNIGPDGTGKVSQEEIQTLTEVAQWLEEIGGWPKPEEGRQIHKEWMEKKGHWLK